MVSFTAILLIYLNPIAGFCFWGYSWPKRIRTELLKGGSQMARHFLKQDDAEPEEQVVDAEELFEINEELRRIYLFGSLTQKLTLRFIKHWDTLSFAYDQAQLKKDPIILVVYSLGGSGYAGLAMYDRIRSSPIPTHTVGTGSIYSAAIALFLAGTKRLIHESAFIGFHQVQPDVCEHSDRDEVEREVRDCHLIDAAYHKIILANSNLTLRKIRQFDRERRQLTAQEAVKYGLAHEIIKNR